MQILLVEDDSALASFLKKGMEQQGHTVMHAANGEAGVEIAAENQNDVIVLDLNLPRLDGVEVLQRMRLGGVQTPVLVLTGRGSVEERIRCLDAGADDFLVKPFSFHEMAARCRAILRRKGVETESSVVRHGALQVDRLTRTVHVHGAEVVLTAKEFALLDYLLQNRKRAVSRPELLEKVWKMAPDSGTNVVDVYVNYLRRKLRTDEGDEDLIVTVRGSGYALAPAAGPLKMVPRKPASDASFPAHMPGTEAFPAVAA
ncbi:response regulator transcription factor [Terriglobus aquaticus]|uniref:Response regulator transcription factor n=1 Tax=Terriglobus aquaticus TaxID=940139 RepID=A0ABW9KMG6_9BACT|nr:response regulator transcription factor [Terriglobus aquaticus]